MYSLRFPDWPGGFGRLPRKQSPAALRFAIDNFKLLFFCARQIEQILLQVLDVTAIFSRHGFDEIGKRRILIAAKPVHQGAEKLV